MFAASKENSFLHKSSEVTLIKLKSRGLMPKDKQYQRMMPAGAGFGVFGLNTLSLSFIDHKGTVQAKDKKEKRRQRKTF